jgi:hypothetical protein
MAQPKILFTQEKPVIFWHVDGGSLSAAPGLGVNWKLPTALGQYHIEALVADGAGGWLRKTRVIEVATDLRPGFSGQVRTNDGGSLTAAHIQVAVNGKSVALGGGLFAARIDAATDGRYVLSITGDGYFPISRVFHRESSGGTYTLERVQVSTFNAGTSQELTLAPADAIPGGNLAVAAALRNTQIALARTGAGH